MRKEECYGVIPLKKGDNGEWEVLILLHKAGNFWGFPKGHKNEKETPLETAKRELFEETHLSITHLLKKNTYCESYSFYKEDILIFKEVAYFAAEVKGKLELAYEEILEAKWWPLKNVADYITFEGTKKIAQDVYKYLNNV